MITCEDHDDCIIVYTSRKCPVCQLQEELNDSGQEVCDLESEIEDYKKYWQPK